MPWTPSSGGGGLWRGRRWLQSSPPTLRKGYAALRVQGTTDAVAVPMPSIPSTTVSPTER